MAWGDMLTPDSCRSTSLGVHMRTLHPSLREWCRSAPFLPPDLHSARRMAKLNASGQKLHGFADLAMLLRGKRLLLLGDSVTSQIQVALECEALRTLGPIQPYRAALHDEVGWKACRGLFDKVATDLSCRCALPKGNVQDDEVRQYALRFSTCAMYGRRTAPTSIEVSGWTVPSLNFTVIPSFGGEPGHLTSCSVCQNSTATKCPLVEYSGREKDIPSSVSLATATGAADVIVANRTSGFTGTIARRIGWDWARPWRSWIILRGLHMKEQLCFERLVPRTFVCRRATIRMRWRAIRLSLKSRKTCWLSTATVLTRFPRRASRDQRTQAQAGVMLC